MTNIGILYCNNPKQELSFSSEKKCPKVEIIMGTHGSDTRELKEQINAFKAMIKADYLVQNQLWEVFTKKHIIKDWI